MKKNSKKETKQIGSYKEEKTVDKTKSNKENNKNNTLGNKKIDSNQNNLLIQKQYKNKLVINVILFLLTSILCFLFASRTLEREKLKPIIYSENGSIDYKVYLNDNNFYTEKYLGMNRAYIASLIKYIDVDYNYVFSIGQATQMNFDYKVIGELIIENSNGSNRYLEKEYIISDNENAELNNNYILNINKKVKIDYSFYNQLANSFRHTYGVDTNSYLNVYLQINAKTNDNKLNYNINENSKVLLKIPLSERAIEINLDTNNQNITKQITPMGKMVLNKVYLVFEIVFLICCSSFLVKCIRYAFLVGKQYTLYDKYVNKILREYDRLIVETQSKPDFNKYNIISVKEFTELLDVRDNLKQPVIYFNIIKHQEGVFYIKDNNDIFLLKVNEENLEKNRIKKL